jgi:hypothetical protein
MAWTEITRPKYQRDGLRYASDTTDEEWTLIEPHIPLASCGRTRETISVDFQRHGVAMAIRVGPSGLNFFVSTTTKLNEVRYECRAES